jgi:hypothetical protein
MEPVLVDKMDIYPRFGLCTHMSDGSIVVMIRKDLPKCVRDFLTDHEEGHFDDLVDREGFFEKELESNWRGFIRHPIGGIVTFFMSLSWYRLKYYLQRIKEKK